MRLVIAVDAVTLITNMVSAVNEGISVGVRVLVMTSLGSEIMTKGDADSAISILMMCSMTGKLTLQDTALWSGRGKYYITRSHN